MGNDEEMRANPDNRPPSDPTMGPGIVVILLVVVFAVMMLVVNAAFGDTGEVPTPAKATQSKDASAKKDDGQSLMDKWHAFWAKQEQIQHKKDDLSEQRKMLENATRKADSRAKALAAEKKQLDELRSQYEGFAKSLNSCVNSSINKYSDFSAQIADVKGGSSSGG